MKTRSRLAAATAALTFCVAAGAAAASEDVHRLLGAPRGTALSGPALAAETEAVAALLRCPVCQGLSVTDSPTEVARDMKAQAAELLAQGYDREQVLAYFEASYGEFVRLEPPRRGVNWLVWAGPLAGLLLGSLIVTLALGRLRGAPVASPDDESGARDPTLEPYLLRVREMAYGWPGGRRPGKR